MNVINDNSFTPTKARLILDSPILFVHALFKPFTYCASDMHTVPFLSLSKMYLR